MKYDVAVVGAGPAGSAAAIELARAGARVLLLEKSTFPHHKVCGEFLSPEVAAVLAELGCSDVLAPAAHIESGQVLTPSGCLLDFRFQVPAHGLSRWSLDAGLARHARAAGAVLQERTEIAFAEGGLLASRDGRRFEARAVLLACGRHSVLNPARTTDRACFGFKAHYCGAWPPRLHLHFFPGGYLGVSPIEDGQVNACAMVRRELLKDADSVVEGVVGKKLKRATEFVFAGPLLPGWQTCPEHMLTAGDVAAFLDPFIGDGISLALRSGRLAARHLLAQLRGGDPQRVAVEYARDLRRLCGRQVAVSRLLRLGAGTPLLEVPVTRLFATSAALRRGLFRITRGNLAAPGHVGGE